MRLLNDYRFIVVALSGARGRGKKSEEGIGPPRASKELRAPFYSPAVSKSLLMPDPQSMVLHSLDGGTTNNLAVSWIGSQDCSVIDLIVTPALL